MSSQAPCMRNYRDLSTKHNDVVQYMNGKKNERKDSGPDIPVIVLVCGVDGKLMELHGIGITVKIQQRPQGLIFSVLKQSHTIFQRRKMVPGASTYTSVRDFLHQLGTSAQIRGLIRLIKRTKQTHKSQLCVLVSH